MTSPPHASATGEERRQPGCPGHSVRPGQPPAGRPRGELHLAGERSHGNLPGRPASIPGLRPFIRRRICRPVASRRICASVWARIEYHYFARILRRQGHHARRFHRAATGQPPWSNRRLRGVLKIREDGGRLKLLSGGFIVNAVLDERHYTAIVLRQATIAHRSGCLLATATEDIRQRPTSCWSVRADTRARPESLHRPEGVRNAKYAVRTAAS